MASNVACPGLRPLRVSEVAGTMQSGGVQMVGVVQTEPAALVLELVWREALQ